VGQEGKEITPWPNWLSVQVQWMGQWEIDTAMLRADLKNFPLVYRPDLLRHCLTRPTSLTELDSANKLQHNLYISRWP
jgi:hypothetical protein